MKKASGMSYLSSNAPFIPSLVGIKLKKSLSNEEQTSEREEEKNKNTKSSGTCRNKMKSLGTVDDLQEDDDETNEAEMEKTKKKKKKKFNLVISKPNTNTNTNSNASKLILYNFRQYKNRKVFRTLLTVTCSLIIFWAPWIILWPVDAACQCVPRYVYIWIYSMEYMNSLANSMFIVAGNQHFRRKFLFYMRKLIFAFSRSQPNTNYKRSTSTSTATNRFLPLSWHSCLRCFMKK